MLTLVFKVFAMVYLCYHNLLLFFLFEYPMRCSLLGKCFTCCVLVFCLQYVWPSFTPDLICVHIVMLSALFQTVEALSSIPSPELALRLYLHCAEVCHIYVWGRVGFAGLCCLCRVNFKYQAC